MMKKTVLFLLLCMAAAPGLSQTLTLDECRAAAEEHNRTLKTSRLDLDAALQARREAFTTYFPQVSASGGVFQAQHGLVQADFAIPQMGSLPLSLVKRGILGSVTAVQPLFAGLKIVSGNKLARLGEEVAQLQLQKTAAEVRERTDTYFWQVVSLRDNLSTIEAVERQLAEIHRQVALSIKAGLVTTNDLLRVELRRQEVASNRLKVENGLKVSKMLLAQHIGADWHTFDIAASDFGEPEAPAAYYVPVDEALDRALTLYGFWAAWKPEQSGVLVAYASFHGHTAEAAKLLAEKLHAQGETVEVIDLNRVHKSYAVSAAFKYDRMALCATTYDSAYAPAMEAFLSSLKLKGMQGRKVALVENGTWAPMAAKHMRAVLDTMKNMQTLDRQVTIRSAMNAKNREELAELAQALAL